ncbi:hypothetical protein D3C80_1151560 [compost metagenome]
MSVNHRRQEHVVGTRATDLFRHPDDPRQQAWRRDDRQARVAAEGIDAFELDDEVEALVHQQRERVGRVEADRGDDRGDLVAEEAPHPGLELGVPVTAANKADLVFLQLRQQHIVEDRVLTMDLAVHHFTDSRQRLVRLQAVSAGLLTGKGDLLLQARHTNFEELIQVAGEDQQELQPLQQRIVLIQRLFQHADIELQLGQLAVNVQAAVIQTRNSDGRGNWRRGRRRRLDLGHRLRQRSRLRRRFEQLLRYRLGLLHVDITTEYFVIHLAFLKGVTALSSIEQREQRNRSGCHQLLPV